jgi:hypothetical protein
MKKYTTEQIALGGLDDATWYHTNEVDRQLAERDVLIHSLSFSIAQLRDGLNRSLRQTIFYIPRKDEMG